MGATILKGRHGRLDAASSVASTDEVTIYQGDVPKRATVNQVAIGANAVDGPGSSTNDAFARWDGTTGLLIQNSTSTMDDSGNATFAGDLTVSGGDIDAGASGTAGTVDIFPSTASMGKIALTAADNAGDTTTTIVNASQAGARTYTIPDAGASTNFVMDANVTGYQKFLGFADIVHNTNNTNWATVRIGQGDITFGKSAADETSILVLDITESVRTAASKGLQLTGFNYIFRNITAALDAHTVTLDRVEYTDSAAVSVNSIGLTGSLGTGTDADPQIDSITVTTPAFNNTANSKYVMEITVDAAATSVYDFIGVVLTFTRNDFD